MFIVVAMEEQVPIIEGRRRPQPEELRRDCRLRGLRIGHANRAHTPAAIAGAAPAGEITRHPSGIDLPAPLAALRHARHVHHGAGADAADEAWLQDRRGAAGEEQFPGDAGVVGRNAEAQFVQRFNHLQRDRANAQIHALAVEDAAGEQAVLLAARQHRNRAIDDVEVRVDAHRHAHHRTAIRRLRAEEIAIIEITVRPRNRDRFRSLVDGIIIGAAEHGPMVGQPYRHGKLCKSGGSKTDRQHLLAHLCYSCNTDVDRRQHGI